MIMSKYKVKCLETGAIYGFTVNDILDEINRDHGDDFTPYTVKDWREGWSEWCEGYTYAMQGVTL